MARPSKCDRLPADLRDLIRAWRGDGRTVDEILAELRARGAQVTRSALARHVRRLDQARPVAVAEELRAIGATLLRIERHLSDVQSAINASATGDRRAYR